MLDNFKNLLVSIIPTSPAFYLALEDPSTARTLTTILLPILFFCIGKTVDVLMQIYFRRQEAKRREKE